MKTTLSEQAAFHAAVVRNAVEAFSRANRPAIAEVCELLDCGLVSDVACDGKGPVVIGIGQAIEPQVGSRRFWATPSFKKVTELEAFCQEHLAGFRALDLERDGIPAKWFWEV